MQRYRCRRKKARQIIRKTIKHNPLAYIVIVGCYAQLRAKELMAIDGVNLVLSTKDKFNIEHYLKFAKEQEKQEIHSCDIFNVSHFDSAFSYGDRTRSFLKIQDGCNYFCTYCTIPFARGKSRSSSIEQVVKETRILAEKGIKEIILTGVNTGDFGNHSDDHQGRTNETLLDLIKTLDALDCMERFRISSIEPNLLTDDIIEYIAKSSHFMPHFHIPLQSGSNEVLKLMKRKYTRELFEEKVKKIKKLCPDAFIGVDVIVGMRGETKEYFEDSKDFISKLDISQLHVFPYSERSGTKALDIPFIVSQSEKHHRVNELIKISDEKLNAFYKKFEGEERPVLFEESNSNGEICGFTDNYLRVHLPYDKTLANKIINVKLINNTLIIE